MQKSTRTPQNVKTLRNVRTSLRLELKDKPGQLKAAIEPISNSGANIITISHQRDEKSASGDLIVDIVISIQEPLLQGLLDALRANDVTVARVGTEHLIYTKAFILIGHILHTDLTDTINRIDRANIAEVTELHLIMPKMSEKSTAKITKKAVGEAEMEAAVILLTKIAEEKHIMIIDEPGGLSE